MASSTAVHPLSPVLQTVAAAAKRHYLALSLEQLPWAVSTFLAGTALLLLLGTRYLHPRWLLLFAALGIGLAAKRIYTRRTSRYRIAQLLDHRLQLHDSLSTAWYILQQQPTVSTPTRAVQVDLTEALVPSINTSAAFPLPFRRVWWLPGTLLVLCFLLVALRWGHASQLDLRRPLIPSSLEAVLNRTEAQEEDTVKAQPPGQQAADANLQLPSLPGTPPSNKPASTAQAPLNSDSHGGPNSLSTATPEGRTPSSPEASESTPGAKQGKSQNSSVLDRMKDALGGMVSKMQQAMKPKAAAGQKNSKDGQKSAGDDDAQASQDSAKDASNKASSKSDKQGQSSQGDSNSEAQAVEKNQPGQTGDSTASNDQHGNNAQSGAGRNDGRKEMQDAAQLKAIGKLAEIIGKRSASLTGDMTIEKPSGAQQLKTQYSNQNAAHTDLGGDLNHDQIPLEYRDFIRTYMQEVHQAPPAHPKSSGEK